jgi:RecA-family ATPase
MNKEIIINTLKHINVATLTRDKWLAVGMALHFEGFPCSVWEEWSKNDIRFHEGECTKIWAGFHGSQNPVTGASIIQIAKDFGFNTSELNDVPLQWDSSIDQDGIAEIEHDTNFLKPTQQLIKYLTALHNPHDIVGYVTNDVFLNPDGAYKPKQGVFSRTVEEIIISLKKHPDNINETIGDFKPEAGAWIRPNPLDGKGIKNENVTKHNYVLVESDDLPIDEQIALFKKYKLPIAAMVYSGGKSIHAIVHIDAKNKEEYRQRVEFLYSFLEKKGVSIDKQNKNPSRLSRMPGVTRNGKRQALLATNIGKKTWQEWFEFVNGVLQDNNQTSILPDIEPLAKYIEKQPPLPNELIKGILREGHKLLIAGPSKVGKSFLLMELSVAIASGSKWLGFECAQSRVLYVNLEIDNNSCIDRFFHIFDKLNIDIKFINNIDVWNLRGHSMPLNELAPELIERTKNKEYKAIIIDPIYKVLTGDENSATDMGNFCNEFDRLCTETGCCIIYSHHHSKGAQGYRKSQDRPSGSGVFARDPDALLNISEVELSSEIKKEYGNIVIFRLESSLREFKNIQPLNLSFSYPIHIVDTTGFFDHLPLQGSIEAGAIKAQNANNKKREGANEEFRNAFNVLNKNNNGVAVKDLSKHLSISRQAVYDRVHVLENEYKISNGTIHKK